MRVRLGHEVDHARVDTLAVHHAWSSARGRGGGEDAARGPGRGVIRGGTPLPRLAGLRFRVLAKAGRSSRSWGAG